MKKTLSSMLLLLATMTLFACGGGGGGYGGNTPPPTQPTKAVVKLFTQGTLTAGTSIGAIDVTVILPAGVSVKATAQSHETDPGVVVASGVASQNSIILGNYSAPTATAPANVRLALANATATGFGTGEFATMNCDIAAGSNPTQAGFSTANASFTEAATITPLSGLTVGLTAVFQ